jgi:hypothetical protein
MCFTSRSGGICTPNESSVVNWNAFTSMKSFNPNESCSAWVSLPSPPWRTRVATPVLGPLSNDQAHRRHNARNLHAFSVRSETCRIFSASLAQGKTCHLGIDRRFPPCLSWGKHEHTMVSPTSGLDALEESSRRSNREEFEGWEPKVIGFGTSSKGILFLYISSANDMSKEPRPILSK